MESQVQKRGCFSTMKKGQISLFIIMGLIILLVFFFLFYLWQEGVTGGLEEQRRRAIITSLEAGAIEYLTEDCTRQALKSGLILIGEQGGYIFEDQPGGFPTPPTMVYNNSRVAYDILYNNASPQNIIAPPIYPCPHGFLNQSRYAPRYCKYPNYDGVWFFGDKSRAWPDLSGRGLTMQTQLESYMGEFVQNCTNFTGLMQNVPGIEVVEGEPNVSVVFGVSDVFAKVVYPVDVEIGQAEPVQHFFDFGAKVDVRFDLIYNLIDSVLEEDNTNESYDILNEIPGEFRWRTGEMEISGEKGAEGDIFILKDAGSKIDNQPYVFRFSRQNRPPILYYISNNETEDLPGRHSYEYLRIEGEMINITAEGSDPDEDIPILFEFASSELDDRWGNNYLKNTTGLARWPPYNLTAKVSDPGGLEDWQRIRLFVDQEIQPNFTINSYPAVKEGVVTVEDPVIWNANLSKISLAPGTRHSYYWEYWGPEDEFGSNLEYFEIEKETDCLAVPGLGNCSAIDYDIENIEGKNLSLTGQAKVFLELTAYYSNRTQKAEIVLPIEVKECMPVRNSSPPWPYNTSDPYLADHSCCLGNLNNPDSWRLANSSTICHRYTESCNANHSSTVWVVDHYCDGKRGNICGGNKSILKICGNISKGCNPDSNCQGVLAYGYKPGSGWCYGGEGCSNFCQSPVVDTDNDGKGDKCGCTFVLNRGDPCDADFNGKFEGNCTFGGSCV